jgi:hypothetical protein
VFPPLGWQSQALCARDTTAMSYDGRRGLNHVKLTVFLIKDSASILTKDHLVYAAMAKTIKVHALCYISFR